MNNKMSSPILVRAEAVFRATGIAQVNGRPYYPNAYQIGGETK